ncbi:4-alpha-glucanotransferase [Pseudonocardia ailaonensis]|uniref:4-alpha-glucanotransferase n=1 Tax=Pseudonocardia ailaonensis TaxID=367279 RepID=UPI003CD09C7C
MDPDLAELAAAHGVATGYNDGDRRPVEVDEEVIVEVLGLLDVDASTPAARTEALARTRAEAARGLLPGTIGTRTDLTYPLPAPGTLTAEDGSVREVTELSGLEPGWYRLTVPMLDSAGSASAAQQQVTVVVAPATLPATPRSWGWMLQLYALHSQQSWGIGDLGDLRDFTAHAAEQGASAILLNPLHAITPVPPVQPSPYTPSSRRFTTPLALRVTDLPEYAAADAATRAEVDALRPETVGDRIAHDRVWAAKRSAAELLWRAAGRPEPVDPSPDLVDFATYCALAERFGGRWSLWPEELRHPGSPAIAEQDLGPRIAFHGWLQQRVGEQLASAREAARGMALGVIGDLAVGCDPEGADAWALQDVLRLDVTVGAPPDAFNQRGQAWGLPPWRPDRLAETGYAAYRDMLRALLGNADGLRIDHVAGLFRLWWVPPGRTPDRGTYVHYDAAAMLAVLTLEASRAGAAVIGEDLGTVEPEVTEALHSRNMLGSTVLWFARDLDDRLMPPAEWPEEAVATISTHDLPTAAGFLTGEHVRARADLDLLDDVPAEERRAAADREELVGLLVAEGLTSADAPDEELVVAMHSLLAGSRCRLVLASPYDVIGETRQPNLPGTIDEYPNWRLPLPLSLEELRKDQRVTRVVAALRSGGR